MKLVIDLDETWSYEESISVAIKEAIEAEVGKAVRKLVRAAVDENKSAIIAVANAYARRMVAEAEKAAPLPAAPASQDAIKDDAAVDALAVKMKTKLAQKRAEGYGGWDEEDECDQDHLSDLLRRHVAKGDPVDVANFCAFLSARGEGIARPAQDPASQDAEDAERYRLLRRGQRWSIINGIGDELRADALDAEIDAARARQRRDKRQPWTEMEDE